MTWLTKGLIWLMSGVLVAIASVGSWYAGINPYWGIMGLVFVGFSLYRSYKAFIEVWRTALARRPRSRLRPRRIPIYQAMSST
jgi:hypothetical protein